MQQICKDPNQTLWNTHSHTSSAESTAVLCSEHNTSPNDDPKTGSNTGFTDTVLN